jgi:hypothetical protein
MFRSMAGSCGPLTAEYAGECVCTFLVGCFGGMLSSTRGFEFVSALACLLPLVVTNLAPHHSPRPLPYSSTLLVLVAEKNNEVDLIYDQLNTIFNTLLPAHFYRVMGDLNYTTPQCRPLAPLAVGDCVVPPCASPWLQWAPCSINM